MANPDKRSHEVEILAYRLWQSRGCPVGSPEDDWYRAEQALQNAEWPNADWSDAQNLSNAENNVDNTDMGSPVEILAQGLDGDEFPAASMRAHDGVDTVAPSPAKQRRRGATP